MTAALRGDWAIPAEPQAIPLTQTPPARRSFGQQHFRWSSPSQALVLAVPQEGHGSLDRWTPQSGLSGKSSPAPEAELEEPGRFAGALEGLCDFVTDQAATWFGAVHLQHLSADDFEEGPEAQAAHDVRERAEAGMTWSSAFSVINPKLQTTSGSLASTLRNFSGGLATSPAGRWVATSPAGRWVATSPAGRWVATPVSVLGKAGEGKEFEEVSTVKSFKESYGLAEDEEIIQRQFLPFFSCFQCAFCLLLWVLCAAASGEETAGLETVWPGKTDLSLQVDCESNGGEMIYRWWTHQFTHVGFGHVFMNCLMTLFFGINLEGYHGSRRLALMFNVGVLGGALCYVVSDVHTRVVGMSGGCYALVGMHFGDVLMNFSEQRRAHEHFERLPPEQKAGVENLWRKMSISPLKKVTCLVFMVLVDALQASLTLNGQTSHSVHFGGFIAGFLICIVAGRNLVVQGQEQIFWLAALTIGTGLVIFCLSWGLSWPPRDIFDATPWCWGRQVANRTVFRDNAWHCVRCADHACIARWSLQRHIEKVSDRICLKADGWVITER